MTDLFDFFAERDTAPIAPACQPIEPDRQPEPPICQPIGRPASWAYRPLRGVPDAMIGRACLCGAQEERPGPSLANVACWRCSSPDGMRPTPWCATAAEIAREVAA